MHRILFFVSIGIVALFGVIWFMGSNNVQTPAGYVGYIRQGSVFGKTSFVGTQTGPTSSGRHWLYEGQNVSITPYTENELWDRADQVLAKDKLPINLSAHLVWKLKSDRVQDFMENYGGVDEHADPDKVALEAYGHFIRQKFRNTVRAEIEKYPGLDVNENLVKINVDILATMQEKLKGGPFEVLDAVIGSCIIPEAVTSQISLKVAAKQELERKATELEIANKQEAIQSATGRAAAALEFETAKGKAQAMGAIKKELTHEYLTYKAIEAMSGANRVYIPLGTNGLPVVGNFDLNEKTEKK